MASRSDWERLDALFDEVLQRPPAERAEALAEACRRHPRLADELRALAEAAETLEGFLETPERSLPPDLLETLAAERDEATLKGERLGAYRVLRRLARGGMGSVYLAERADGEFEQQVAIKLLNPGLSDSDFGARFRAEAQILAALVHPDIARLLDAGTAPDGRPYLVLEHVEGLPITEYADAARLGVDERLRLFLVVCRAVRHAHRNLVVHRDLKPGNILVTETGGVKLLDFGIAKLLQGEADGVQAPATRTGLHLMTPEYATPEQLLGEPITTATDVYQLGLLLYELLTGRRPHAFDRNASAASWERTVVESDPPPPSSAFADPEAARDAARSRGTDPARLRRRLGGDLDTISLMALRVEPERRYGSVEALANDVELHLDGRPVTARPDDWAYRARKYVQRHRLGVAVAAVLLLAALGYLGTITAYAERLAEERNRARAEAATAAQVSEFLVSLFEVANPLRTGGEEVTARELLDEGVVRVRRELAEQPELLAHMLSTMGRVYWELDRPTRAIELVDEALAIRRDASPGASPDLAAPLRVRAEITDMLHGPEAADPWYREALAATEAAHGPDHPLVAEVLVSEAEAFRSDRERSDSLFTRALEIYRAAPPEYRADYSETLKSSAYGRPERDDRIHEALAIQRELYGERHALVAETLSDLALLADREGDRATADSLARLAVEIHREAAGEDHPMTLVLKNNLAGILREDDRTLDEAAVLYGELIDQRRRLTPGNRQQNAYPVYGLALVRTRQGRGAEAESLLGEIADVFPPADARNQAVQRTLARALTLQGRRPDAEAVLLELVDGTAGPTDRRAALEALVALYEEWDRTGEAERWREALETGEP